MHVDVLIFIIINICLYYRIKQSSTINNKKRKNSLKQSKSGKKPKAGKGKRDLHKKVGGRKRR